MVVCPFDETKRDILGKVPQEVKIERVDFNITFQVLKTIGSFNMLLGRPWIYIVGVVPSIIQQRIKFIMGDKLITVKGEYNVQISNEV